MLAGRRIAGAMEQEEAVGSRETAVARRESALERRHKEVQGRETAVEAREQQADDLVQRVKNAELGLHFETEDRLKAERDCGTAQRERNEAQRNLGGAGDRGRTAGRIAGRAEREQELQKWLPTHDKAVETRAAQAAAEAVLKREVAVGEREELQEERDQALRDLETRTTERNNATNDARTKRDQALRDLETRTTERNNATNERNEAREQVKTVQGDLDDWVERFVKVVRDLNPGRAELDRAAGRAGIGGQWLAQEVERGRGGMDR